MNRFSTSIIIGVIFLSLFASTGFATPATIHGLEQGKKLLETGKANQALAVLRDFVRNSPSSTETAKASALIGRIFSQQHNFTDAILYLKLVPVIFRSPEIDFLLGNSYVQTNNFSAGLQLLQPLLNEPLNHSDKTTLYRALTKATTQTQQYLLALYFLQQQLPTSDNPAAIIAKAHQLLQNSLTDSDLAEAAFVWQQTAIGQDARLQLARRALVQQQNDLAKVHLQKLFASPTPFPYWHEAEQLQRRTSTENWLSRDSIGVLLPLSGDYASYGDLVKNGLELALQEHNKTQLPARFIYKDTAIPEKTSAQQVISLSAEDKVMAIIGPLLAKSAELATQQAQLEMVPLITMAQGNKLPEVGNFIFRDTLTAEQQVKALVDFAIASNHISFSILRPENRLGQKMSDLFVTALQQVGGEIIDIVSYPEDSTDFKKQIEQLLWEDRVVAIPEEEIIIVEGKEEETTEKRKPIELEYPLAPSHALFIPDYADKIKQIAPQLLFYGLKDVTLLGISGWNSNDLASRTGRFLANAVFVDAFFAASTDPEVQRFVELYRQTYKQEPTILEAQAFEIATILLQIIDDPEVENRDDLRNRLTTIYNFNGIAGTSGFDVYGEAIKQLYLLQIKHGQIIEQ